MANFNFLHKVKNVYCGHRYLLGKVSQGLVHRPMCFSSSSSSPPIAGQISSTTSAAHLHRSSPWLTLLPEIDTATGEKVDRFYSMTDKRIFKLNRETSLKVPKEAVCFSSSRGWLAFIDPTDCSIYLSNPFLRDNDDDQQLVQLPSIETLPNILGVSRNPSSSNSINHFLMAGDPRKKNSCDSPRCFSCDSPRYFSRDSENTYFTEKPAAISESLFVPLTLSCEPFKEDCIAMFAPGHVSPQLAFCRIRKDEHASWTSLCGAYFESQSTVCPFNGGVNKKMFFPSSSSSSSEEADDSMKLFYSLYYDMFDGGGIDAWEISRFPARRASFMYVSSEISKLDEGSSKFKTTTEELDIRERCTSHQYLVVDELSGHILLVVRYRARHVAEDGTIVDYDPSFNLFVWNCGLGGPRISVDPYQVNAKPMPYKTLRFDVFKVDMKRQKMKQLKSLGDKVIFLGLNQSFTLSAGEFPGLTPNSIYFTDDWGVRSFNDVFPYGGHDMGIYNLGDDSIEPCYPFPEELNKTGKIRRPLVWVAPNSSC